MIQRLTSFLASLFGGLTCIVFENICIVFNSGWIELVDSAIPKSRIPRAFRDAERAAEE
jgi:hypothetical protein